MSTTTYLIFACLLLFGVSIATRCLPFLFSDRLANNPWLTRLGTRLPPCILIILVAYSLKETSLLSYPFGLPEALSIAIVALIHLWRNNVLLSVAAGVAAYQILLMSL